MDPITGSALISGGLGLLGGILGGGGPPSYVKQSYDLGNKALQDQFDLYNRTNWDTIDQQALAAYQKAMGSQLDASLKAYMDRMGGAGSPAWKYDTEKMRGLNQIAGDAGSKLGLYEANQISTRPMRQGSLIPQPSQAYAGGQLGQAIDNRNLYEQDRKMQGLMDLAGVDWGSVFSGGRSPGPGVAAPSYDLRQYDPNQQQDRYGNFLGRPLNLAASFG